jgi:hypothetical protein
MTGHDKIKDPPRFRASDRQQAAKRQQQAELKSIRDREATPKPPPWIERLGRHFVRDSTRRT